MPSSRQPASRAAAAVHLREVSRPELLAAGGDDPWLRWALPDPVPHAVLADGVAVVQRLGHRPGFWVVPLRPARGPGSAQDAAERDEPDERERDDERERVVAVLRTFVRDGLPGEWGATSASVPQEHAAAALSVLGRTGQGGDWEWMWTTTAPRRDIREELLVALDDRRDAEELSAFARAHNPRVWTRIGEGHVVRWVGLRDADGGLVAVGGAELEATGVPHLAGILTATHARGQGWGEVVSSALTRWAVDRDGVCTLGMFSDNATARRLYLRLGYVTARAWHSRMLSPGAG
ncbi:GNAT family N-acetyltransferase [Ornithinimicrobium cerasi]|uniref:FR47-like protein n=1 Tax=Ornithinimicrobium cerasi TaxID=2248773 RepID=A0A285VKN7_9MICO|nr:GNAT family N-acetyltransferase [Ornithinimicrobium cerasi]SOC54650.1 FR47-like protein [Ornithinimicrobium cerasi]